VKVPSYANTDFCSLDLELTNADRVYIIIQAWCEHCGQEDPESLKNLKDALNLVPTCADRLCHRYAFRDELLKPEFERSS